MRIFPRALLLPFLIGFLFHGRALSQDTTATRVRTFEIAADRFSTNHFFVDTSYIPYYEPYYQGGLPLVSPQMRLSQVVETEVWVSVADNFPGPTDRLGVARVDVPQRPGIGYSAEYRTGADSAGRIESATFTRLDPTEYELTDGGVLGVVTILRPIQDDQIVAIAYRRADGVQYGQFERDIDGGDPRGKLVLKMLRPKDLLIHGPEYVIPWRMMLKNIYPIGGKNLRPDGFKLNIARRPAPGQEEFDLLGVPLVEVLGVDRDTDGAFDFKPARTVIPGSAEIIFPSLEPFSKGIEDHFETRGRILTDRSVLNPEVYLAPPGPGALPPGITYYLTGSGTWEDLPEQVAEIDTSYVVYMDSTARMAHFKVSRKDSRVVNVFPDRTYTLFANPNPQIYKRETTIDSTGFIITFRETVGGKDVKTPVQMSLRDYLAAERKDHFRRLLAAEARKPPVLGPKDDVGELLSNLTQIEIPVPPNPIFSIFGKPEIKLNISGAVDIKAGFRNTKSDQIQISTQDQSRNEPDFSQDVQVNVNGTIGDKLNILADWNTQRTFEYENQLKIKYTGYDDEIVKSVEAGNVSLQTPSTFIGNSQALFGVKAQFQAGPMTLTTLASQKKGEIKEVSVSGGSQQSEFVIPAYRYAQNHFFVDTLYRQFYEDYYTNDIPITNAATQIIETEVWVQLLGNDQNQIALSRQGISFVSLDPRPGAGYADSLRGLEEIPGLIETARFIKLEPNIDYEMTGDGYLGVISFNVSIQDNQVVGIAYRTIEGNQYGEFARDLGLDSIGIATTLVLKMVKPRNLTSNGRRYVVAWDQMLKNIYSIGGRNLKKEGFVLDVYRSLAGQEDQNSILNERLLRVLGIDNYNDQGTRVEDGDGTFDFRPGFTINQSRAELIFPTLRPFDEGIRGYFSNLGTTVSDSSEFIFPEVYDTTQTGAQNSQRNSYTIKGLATGEASSRYTLGFNIVEGSVEVLLDGVPLTPNVDYTVDYIIGEVVIRNNRALVPGANVQIKYEQNDLFQLASKTLLGARGDLALSKKTFFGFTVMNLNQESLSDKVRIGEEPSNNTIMGVDGSTTVELPALTKALDALPVFETREQSQIKISGEAAYMLPDPNTKKSTIVSDQGAGIAYIDDFEGARRTIPLGISYSQWTLASPPADSVSFPPLTPDTSKVKSKGRFIWYNVLPSDVLVNDIFPKKEVGRDQQQVTVLDFLYAPDARGAFNYSADIDNDLTQARNWGGVMKPISISATNLVSENINFIELWLRVEDAPMDETAKLVIDIGSISEDVIPNRELNSEDRVLSENINGTLQEGEDVGLDMLTNAEEISLYGTTWSPDPSGDNFSFQTGSLDFSFINGTEGNGRSSGGLVPDTEDLNSNGQVDLINQYFQYDVSLDTVRSRNPLVVGGGSNGWYQFRIPLIEFQRTVGTPNFENVEYIRAFFRNASDTIRVRIADFNLVGNQWQELVKGDSTFQASVVNIEDNPEYISPPGVIREQDRTRPDENILSNEQSLSLQLKGVPDGESRMAVKYYTFKPLDLFNYRTMKMFVHGDDDFQYVDSTNYDAEVFFLFGYDTLNYYEYRAPVRPGWDPLNDMVVRFDELTAIKQGRDSTNVLSPPEPVSGGPPGSFYRVLGTPSLTQIRFLAVGVTNKHDGRNPAQKLQPGPALTGQVWVNELRLVDVDDTPGLAYRFDSQLKLADIGTASFNYSQVDPSFHKLEQRFGSRATSTNWGASVAVQVDKLFPDDWTGTSIPFSYTHTDAFVSPEYLPNSDVQVKEAANILREKIVEQGGSADSAKTVAEQLVTDSETHRTTDTYAAPAIKIGLPSREWYVRDTFNKLTFGFNYTKSFERSPATIRRNAWSWNARVSYAVNLSPDYFISPFGDLFDGVWAADQYKGWKFFFTPSTFNWSLGLTRGKTVQLQRQAGSRETITRNFPASREMGFTWKFTEGGILNPVWNYKVNVQSSLLDLETDSLGNQRPFSAIISEIFFGDKLINFGSTTRHTQQNQYTTKPNLPNIFNMNSFFDHSFSYNVDYTWQNTLVGGDLGKSAGFSNSINYTTNIKLKQMFDPLWGDEPVKAQPPGGRGRRRGATPDAPDTTAATDQGTGGLGALDQLKNLLRLLIKVPLLDYDNITLSFTQTNNASGSGILGGTGFKNFWAVPFAQEQDPESGPTRLFQLGLITDPTGQLTNFGSRSGFPFFGWDVEPGRRAVASTDARVNLVNTFRQTNRVNLKTSRSLWEGVRLDLNWNINWTFARNQTFPTDSLGFPDFLSPSASSTTTGSIDRTFLTFPDVLFLGVFNTSLKEVGKRFTELKADGDSTVSEEQKLSQAFEEGFEALPWLKSIFGQYYPRINWSLRWDGLEKVAFFSGFATRVSLDHAYTSGYVRNFRTLPGTFGEITDNQRVSYGFNPLFGLNLTFKEILKGNFGANVRYNTTTSYDLSPSSRNIIEALTQEISITASFSKKGFEFPLFGISLNNDIDVSFSYSISKNSRRTYEVSKLEFDTEGTPLEGTTRTVIEPRIKYVLSLRVNASVYYRYTKIAPDDSGSRIPGQTINEAGLDVHIAIR
ncbi:MAG: cell surface protein SprA [Ignavibacteria bacterium]|nr:cell surface protein SprA [Ignavibacteria bacterium]